MAGKQPKVGLDDVYRTDEVFCTGTMGELVCVTKIDNRIIGDRPSRPDDKALERS
jgi:branched-chain amino acid aminotransferase